MALVTLRTFRDPIDAELTRALLESRGIAAFVFDQHTAGVQWLYSQAIGGVKVKVEERDLPGAREALAAGTAADLAGIPESEGPPGPGEACPSCGSDRLASSRVQRTAAALSLATGLPLIAWRRRWRCRDCGHVFHWTPRDAREIPPETQAADERVLERRHYSMGRGFLALLLGLAVLWYVQYQIRNPG